MVGGCSTNLQELNNNIEEKQPSMQLGRYTVYAKSLTYEPQKRVIKSDVLTLRLNDSIPKKPQLREVYLSKKDGVSTYH